MALSDPQSFPYSPAGVSTFGLTIIGGPGEGRVIPCRRIVTLIGSREGCKVNLHHPDVAPVHVAILNTGTDLWIRDLASPRGSRLNDQPLEYGLLKADDRFSVGPWLFRVDLAPVPRPDNADVHAVSLEPSPENVVLEHLGSHKYFQPRRQVCLIGRREGCDIAVNDPGVSRCQALLLRYMGHPAICDLPSEVPTLVNGTPTTFQVLADGDLLSVGETRFRVRVYESLVGRNGENGAVKKGDFEAERDSPLDADEREAPDDLVDIRAAESNKRWAAADPIKPSQIKP